MDCSAGRLRAPGRRGARGQLRQKLSGDKRGGEKPRAARAARAETARAARQEALTNGLLSADGEAFQKIPLADLKKERMAWNQLCKLGWDGRQCFLAALNAFCAISADATGKAPPVGVVGKRSGLKWRSGKCILRRALPEIRRCEAACARREQAQHAEELDASGLGGWGAGGLRRRPQLFGAAHRPPGGNPPRARASQLPCAKTKRSAVAPVESDQRVRKCQGLQCIDRGAKNTDLVADGARLHPAVASTLGPNHWHAARGKGRRMKFARQGPKPALATHAGTIDGRWKAPKKTPLGNQIAGEGNAPNPAPMECARQFVLKFHHQAPGAQIRDTVGGADGDLPASLADEVTPRPRTIEATAIPGEAEAAAAAARIRALLAECLEAAWASLAAEFEVQELVWDSVGRHREAAPEESLGARPAPARPAARRGRPRGRRRGAGAAGARGRGRRPQQGYAGRGAAAARRGGRGEGAEVASGQAGGLGARGPRARGEGTWTASSRRAAWATSASSTARGGCSASRSGTDLSARGRHCSERGRGGGGAREGATRGRAGQAAGAPGRHESRVFATRAVPIEASIRASARA
ncbi:unnamed protein product, partial [Prorocentrum cordatum]